MVPAIAAAMPILHQLRQARSHPFYQCGPAGIAEIIESRGASCAVPPMAWQCGPDVSESARSASRLLAYAPNVAYGATLTATPSEGRRSWHPAISSPPPPQGRTIFSGLLRAGWNSWWTGQELQLQADPASLRLRCYATFGSGPIQQSDAKTLSELTCVAVTAATGRDSVT